MAAACRRTLLTRRYGRYLRVLSHPTASFVIVVENESTSAEEVRRVLAGLEAASCMVWLEGGWGVDALVGRQTRPHRDLDIDIDADHEARGLATLSNLGYSIETDWRPNRVELFAPGHGRVDVHPLVFDDEGNGVQAGFSGESYLYPANVFTTGFIGGRPVGCLTVDQQIAWHAGYELRDQDWADLEHLHELDRRMNPRWSWRPKL